MRLSKGLKLSICQSKLCSSAAPMVNSFNAEEPSNFMLLSISYRSGSRKNKVYGEEKPPDTEHSFFA